MHTIRQSRNFNQIVKQLIELFELSKLVAILLILSCEIEPFKMSNNFPLRFSYFLEICFVLKKLRTHFLPKLSENIDPLIKRI